MIKQQFFPVARIYLVAGNAKRHESRLLIKNAFAGNGAWRVVVTQQSSLHFLSAATPVCSLEMAARCSVSRCQRNWLDNKMHTTWCTSIKAAGAHCWTYLRGSYFLTVKCTLHWLAFAFPNSACIHTRPCGWIYCFIIAGAALSFLRRSCCATSFDKELSTLSTPPRTPINLNAT